MSYRKFTTQLFTVIAFIGQYHLFAEDINHNNSYYSVDKTSEIHSPVPSHFIILPYDEDHFKDDSYDLTSDLVNTAVPKEMVFITLAKKDLEINAKVESDDKNQFISEEQSENSLVNEISKNEIEKDIKIITPKENNIEVSKNEGVSLKCSFEPKKDHDAIFINRILRK